MKISLNWIKQFTKVDSPVDELVAKIGAQLGEVESVEDLGVKYKGALIVKVVTCSDHPDADKLHICTIDDGSVVQDIPRGENGHVQVVCGANNIAAGQTVIWLPPGVTVPETYDTDSPFVLESRELRGVISYGMIASMRELAFGDDHQGIVVLDEDIQPGTALAEAYELNDFIIEIENKMFTHRPDLFGQLGVAREIAGIQGQAFKSPEWYTVISSELEVSSSEVLPLVIKNEVPDLVSRFMAVALSGITVKPSPLKLQIVLAKLGIRPINNVVDITNFMMILTAQPLHAYDYDKVKAQSGGPAAEIIARQGQKGEKLTLLGDKTIELRQEDIVIATGKQGVGLGGVMGGAQTEVDENTKNIILECATFDMYSIRKTAMHHGLFTDAVTRFSKGQSRLQNDKVINETVRMIQDLAAAKVASEVFDDKHLQPLQVTSVTPQFINDRLGLSLNTDQITQILQNVEFKIESQISGSKLLITAPFWRTDIEIPEDIVEEVGRLYGYDKLPHELPKRDLKPAKINELLSLKKDIRQTLKAAGANEVLNYSFVHGNLLEKAGQDRELAYQLSNALSPDLQYYRLSILPSLLEKVHLNIKAGYDQFAVFELGKAHAKGWLNQESLPKQEEHLGFVFAANNKAATDYKGAAYYQAREYLVDLLNILCIKPVFAPLNQLELKIDQQVAAPFDTKRSAIITDAKSGEFIGVVGEFKSSVKSMLKLPNFIAGFELDVAKLLQLKNQTHGYVPLPKFPKVQQDISLKIPANLAFGQIFDFVFEQINQNKIENTHFDLIPLDYYQRDDDKDHKQITLRLNIASYQKTLKAGEVNDLLDIVAAKTNQQFGAKRL